MSDASQSDDDAAPAVEAPPEPAPFIAADYRPIHLPDYAVAEGLWGGRALRDGYRRGMALQFHGILDQLAADPLLRLAWEAADGRSIVDRPRLENLFLILTLNWEPLRGAHVVEFGSYRGGSSLFMAAVLRELDPTARVHALDTFTGMPPTDGRLDYHSPGDFSDADLEGLLRRRDALKLDNLDIHQGLFEETFPKVARAAPGFGLAHIDADIYAACRYAAQAVWPHMLRGGYVAFDDATTASCLGATQVVEELIMERRVHAEQIVPHFVFRAGLASA